MRTGRQDIEAELARGATLARCLDIANVLLRVDAIDDGFIRELCTRTLLDEAVEQARDCFEEFGGVLQ